MPTLSESYQYLYDGNQLKRVNMLYMGQYISGAGAEYLYDANGNMTFDGQNHRQLEYNFLNLLLKVEGMNASATYKWLADGTKASVTDNLGYGLEYLGSFVYQKTPTDTSLESVAFGAGRFVANSIGSLTAQYQIVDHLGSVRVVFTSPTNVVAQNDYYAFGLRHSNPNLANSSSNRHLFNGKEWQSTGSVGLLDYGARPYDPNTGRWINIDPLAEQFLPISSYVFSGNNPVKFIDRDGRWFGRFMEDDWIKNKKTGEYEWWDNVTSANNTPSGYKYIGNSGNDILNDMGLPDKPLTDKTVKFGIIADYGPVDATATSYVQITSDISFSKANVNSNNQLGRTFNGISINISTSLSITGQNELIGGANASLKIGNNTYKWNLVSPNGTSVQQVGSLVKGIKVHIPQSRLSNGERLNQITINGVWNVLEPGGRTSVVFPIIPYPRTFTHKWKFNK